MITEKSVNNIMTNEILSTEKPEKIGNDSLHCSTYWCGLALGTQQVTKEESCEIGNENIGQYKANNTRDGLSCNNREQNRRSDD